VAVERGAAKSSNDVDGKKRPLRASTSAERVAGNVPARVGASNFLEDCFDRGRNGL